MDKITWREAVQIEKQIGAYTMHISWFPDLERRYPDCGGVVVDSTIGWRNAKGLLFLILDSPELEESIKSFYTRLAER